MLANGMAGPGKSGGGCRKPQQCRVIQSRKAWNPRPKAERSKIVELCFLRFFANALSDRHLLSIMKQPGVHFRVFPAP